MLGRLIIRILDISLSFVSLVLLSPLFIVLAVRILMADGRPIFFVQPRVGKDGKIFNLIKFRSMRNSTPTEGSETERVNAYSIKVRNDPRITPVGAFLRRTSLDELPQLVNILTGEMSVVGPRPWVPAEYSMFPEDLKAERRLAVKPGLTGTAQISGRSDLPLEDIVRLDCRWISDQSLLGYLRVIFKTARKVFIRSPKEGSGVY